MTNDFNLESLEQLRRRVDCLELTSHNLAGPHAQMRQSPHPDDELLSAKLWLLNRSKQINKEST